MAYGRMSKQSTKVEDSLEDLESEEPGRYPAGAAISLGHQRIPTKQSWKPGAVHPRSGISRRNLCNEDLQLMGDIGVGLVPQQDISRTPPTE